MVAISTHEETDKDLMVSLYKLWNRFFKETLKEVSSEIKNILGQFLVLLLPKMNS
jgi:hypothetical protein